MSSSRITPPWAATSPQAHTHTENIAALQQANHYTATPYLQDEEVVRSLAALARAHAERGGRFNLPPGFNLPCDPSLVASKGIRDQQLCHDGVPIPRLLWESETSVGLDGSLTRNWSSVHPPRGVVAGDSYAPGPSHTPDNELTGHTLEEVVAISDEGFGKLDADELTLRLKYLALQMQEGGEEDRVGSPESSHYGSDADDEEDGSPLDEDAGEEDDSPRNEVTPLNEDNEDDRLDLALMRLCCYDDDDICARKYTIIDSHGMGRGALTVEQISYLLREECITLSTKLYKHCAEDYETVGDLLSHEDSSASSGR
ncbi:hypothetical protein DL546_008637 [Coniochaeta pulveracea]|uniref:Uncharacterized protein n=1 Tax=Coniochaeta pulveracea TaxID=177199 RepID=A0A420YF29_9PEZI|nr:hypothetical protein DL546_008637 [Coniochaeta pulveracea]